MRTQIKTLIVFVLLVLIVGAKNNEPKFQVWKVGQPIEDEKEYWRIFYGGFENVDDVLRYYPDDLSSFYFMTNQMDVRSQFRKTVEEELLKLNKAECEWTGKVANDCKIKFSFYSARALYCKPDIDSPIVGVFDHSFKGVPVSVSQTYTREFSTETEGLTRDISYIPALEVKHIVKSGRIYEWLRLYSPEIETQAWYNVSPLGIIDAPPGTPDGEIPVDYNRAVVRSLKNSKLGARYCVQDINKGEVSFYSFLFLATPFTWRNNIGEYETSKLLKTTEGQQKYIDLVQKQTFSAEAKYKNDPEVLSYLKDIKDLKPHLFKMSFERFYFEYLNGGKIGYPMDQWPFWFNEPKLKPFEYPVDCSKFSEYFYKEISDRKKKRELMEKHAEIFYKGEYNGRLGGLSKKSIVGYFINPRDRTTKNPPLNATDEEREGWERVQKDITQHWYYWPDPIPADKIEGKVEVKK